jgi:hypothetical protein
MRPLKNFFVSLTATGPAAVISILILCISALGLWGEGPIADGALRVLTIFAGMLGALLVCRGWAK